MSASPDITSEQVMSLLFRSRVSFYSFLHHVRILDPPTLEHPFSETRPILPLWPGQRKLYEYLHNRRVLVLKARQLGISWLMGAYALWKAMFFPGAVVMVFSSGEDESAYQLWRSKFIHDSLPEWMRLEVGRSNNEMLEFSAMGSLILAFPSTEKAGSGYTATCVIRDELAKHRNAGVNFASVEPAINAGAQLIEFSTAWGEDDYFKPRWELAEEGRLGDYKHLFLAYNERPDRDGDWRERTKQTYAGLPQMFEQEYPQNSVEAFALTIGGAVVDAATLASMRAGIMGPGRQLVTLGDVSLGTDGVLKIWREPVMGHGYVVGMDPGWGTGEDGSVGQVIDVRDGVLAASLYGTHWHPEEFTMHALRVSDLYQQALLVPEVNGRVGGYIVDRLKADRELRRCYHRDWEEAALDGLPPQKPGWHTGLQSRRLMVTDLVGALRDNLLRVYDLDTIREAGNVVHIGNAMRAKSGKMDDRFFALGIGWQGTRVPRVRSRGPVPPPRSYMTMG